MNISTLLLIPIIVLQAFLIFIIFRQKEAIESMSHLLKDIESEQSRNHMHMTRNVDQLGNDLSRVYERHMVDVVKMNESINFVVERLKSLEEQNNDLRKAIENSLEDLEDTYLASKTLERIHSGEERTS